MKDPTLLGNLNLSRSLLRVLAALILGYVWHLTFDAHAQYASRLMSLNIILDWCPTEIATFVNTPWR